MTYDNMSDILDLHLEHFVKVKVKLLEDERSSPHEYFILDPQSTTYSSLRNHLARLFNIEGEFTVNFKKDKEYLPLTSDWDLDGAIAEASKPYLSLSVKPQPLDKTLEEWDIICPADMLHVENEISRSCEERRSLAGSIISQVETAMLKVQRCLSFDFNGEAFEKHPMSESEFNRLLDKKGRVRNHRELHMAVYKGGVEPSLRSRVWKHLLNVYPHNMMMQERKTYLNVKCEEYYNLRYRWQRLLQAGTIPTVLQDIMTMVRKDVRRTDRTEKFYAGSEDNENVRSLFNILTTYALNHPSVSYCQGMSDLLSPILYVMRKESEAYICFCGLMKRVHTNFRLDGRSMKLKFHHLQKMLRFYDQELYLFLKEQDALDLIFCYRWLLLELKREFPYKEMLNLMEILWGSLPPKPPQKELDLYDVKFPTATICNSLKDRTTSKDFLRMNEEYFGVSQNGHSFSQSVTNIDTTEKVKRWTLRVRHESILGDAECQESCTEKEIKLPLYYRKRKYRSYITGKLGRVDRHMSTVNVSSESCRIPSKSNNRMLEICQSWSCGELYENKSRFAEALCDAREFLRNQWCYSNTVNEIQLNNWLNGRRQLDFKDCMIGSKDDDSVITDLNNRQRHGSSNSTYSAASVDYSEDSSPYPPRSSRSQSEGYMSDSDSKETSTATEEGEEEYEDEVYDSDEDIYEEEYSENDEYIDSMAGHQFEEVEVYFERKKEMLPPPHVLGDGNPFLLFLCIAMIQCHRDEILKHKYDFNELGIYFDKFVRKHRLSKVLLNAQRLFKEYLNMGWDVEDRGEMSDD